MVTDLLLSWPRNCDYPLWRQFLRNNRTKFNEVLISFTETHQGEDYRQFIREAMFSDYVQFEEARQPIAREDWRDLSINGLLLHSYNAPWVWFTEQDFYPLDGFWEEIEKHEQDGADVIAAFQGDRMHPCCIFIKREVLNRTSKNFGIVPDRYDHFYILQKELTALDVKATAIRPETYHHLNGLSHNLKLLYDGERPNHQVEEFGRWLKDSMAVKVPLDDRFLALEAKYRTLGLSEAP